MNKNAFILLSILSIVLFVGIITDNVVAYERPEFNDGLMGPWHPGALCITCHYVLNSQERALSISNGCKCHNVDYAQKGSVSDKKVNSSKIFDYHKNIICVKCHVGTSKNQTLPQDIHRVMSKTDCSKCHVFENGTVRRPEKTKCFECHGGDPHVVHGNKVENVCPACHGEFAERYLDRTLKASEKAMLPAAILNLSSNKEEKKREYNTISEFLTNIINSIGG